MSLRVTSANASTSPAYARADTTIAPASLSSGFTIASQGLRGGGAVSGILATLETTAGRAQLILSSTNTHSWRFTGGIFGSTTLVNTGTVANGIWAHYALVYDGANLITYFNGAVSTTTAPASFPTGTWSYMGLGGPFASAVAEEAHMQDVAFFSRPLSIAEIGRITDKRRLPPRGALEGWFPCISGGAGGVLTDWSDKGRNASTTFGTIVAGTLHAPVSWGGSGTQKIAQVSAAPVVSAQTAAATNVSTATATNTNATNAASTAAATNTSTVAVTNAVTVARSAAATSVSTAAVANTNSGSVAVTAAATNTSTVAVFNTLSAASTATATNTSTAAVTNTSSAPVQVSAAASNASNALALNTVIIAQAVAATNVANAAVTNEQVGQVTGPRMGFVIQFCNGE